MTYDTALWRLAAVDFTNGIFSPIHRVLSAQILKESGDSHYS